MPQNIKSPENPPETSVIQQTLSTFTLYRGFASIDQEMEREIAMQWFSKSRKTSTFLKPGSYKHR